MSARRRPSRRDLLIVIGRLQNALGEILGDNLNDRDPNGCGKIDKAAREAIELCIEARGFDPPIAPRAGHPWGSG